jgi:hypothetical protein
MNTFNPGVSIHDKSAGESNCHKMGTQYFSSLSLFCDDVDVLLRDLYGNVDCEARDRVLRAVRVIVQGLTKYVRKDLWQEHSDALDLDKYIFGIGFPDGYGICGSELRYGVRAKYDLILRVCRVNANPSAFSEYTVEFAKRFSRKWVCTPETAAEAQQALS